MCVAFGFGLSYSTFRVVWHNNSGAARTIHIDDMHRSHSTYFEARAQGDTSWRSPVAYSAEITNAGNLKSDFVLLGFVSSSQAQSDPAEPLRELFDFSRVTLEPAASSVVTLSLPSTVVSHVNNIGQEKLLAGNYNIELGGKRLGDSAQALRTTFTLVGPECILFSLP